MRNANAVAELYGRFSKSNSAQSSNVFVSKYYIQDLFGEATYFERKRGLCHFYKRLIELKSGVYTS